MDQRAWLRRSLAASAAPLKIVVSGSVLLGSLTSVDPKTGGTCSGDDWGCYPAAQANVLSLLANSPSSGCVVVLVGDYHYAGQ